MDIRQITATYHVAPQIDPSDLVALAEAGFTRVICNRPDGENPPSHHAALMAEQAAAAGIDFVTLPLTHQTMTPENVQIHGDAIASAGGKVLAYCASGTRSTVVWALGQASVQSADAILSAAQAGGYDLEGLRPTLNAIAQNG